MEKRIISLTCAILLLSSCLFSCGEAAETGNVAPAPAEAAADTDVEETTDPGPLPEIPDTKYGGQVFRIYCRNDNYGDDFDITGDTSTQINDALYKRNKQIEDIFDITVELYNANDVMGDSALKTLQAGEDTYDIINVFGRYIWSFATSGLVLEWNSQLEYVDFEKPWWYKDFIRDFSVNGKLYCGKGDISFQPLSSSFVM